MIWRMEEQRRYPVLRGRDKADAVVVGGGLSGVTTAFWLSKAGLKVALVEAERIGWAASGQNAGIIAPCQKLGYAELENNRGKSAAEAYAHTHMKAIRSIAELRNLSDMQFPMQKANGWMSAANAMEEQKLELEAEAMKRAGWRATLVKGNGITPVPFAARLKLPSVYLINPVIYLSTLARRAEQNGISIYEYSRVVSVETDAVYTEEGSIQATFIIIASGYPIVNIPGWYFLRLEQWKIALAVRDNSCPEVFMSPDGSFAYRAFGKGMLVRSNAYRVGAEDQVDTGESSFGVECFTPDGLPYIGTYSSQTPNLFVAAGYGGNGIVGSMIAAQAITAAVLGLPLEGGEIYSPQRKMKTTALTLHMSGRYLKGLFGGSDAPRCSHMGCRLVFNPVSRLWECPCHGSRFDDIGRVVSAPAVRAAQLRGRK